MTYDPNGQYPPPNQDPNAGGNYPASGPGYPTSGAGYPTSGAAPASGGAYPQQSGYPTSGAAPASGAGYPQQNVDPYQAGGYQASSYPAAGYQQGGYDPYQAGGAGGVDPTTGQPLSDKTKIAAGLLSIFLGAFGVGRFYLGYTGLGIAQIAVTVVTCGSLGWVWPLIEGIMMLASNSIPDAQGRRLRES